MDLLGADRTASGRAGGRATIAWLATSLLAAACLVLPWFRSGTPRFDHSLHGEEQGLECASCHRDAESGDRAGMPVLQQCQLCHEAMDEGKEPAKQAASFFEEGALRAASVTAFSDEVIFTHESHVADRSLACSECHGDVAASRAVPAEARVTMEECVRCHERAGRNDDCAACHRTIRVDRAPDDHRADWKRLHGRNVVAAGGADEARCSICHTRQLDCIRCHEESAPDDHTNFWRERGHGIAVRGDRGRCATCHQPDACDRCHRETAPRSHTSSWGSPIDRHCVTCHLPVSGENCVVCHAGAPSHALAAPQPPDHAPGMNCRQCHGLTAPLPHPDPGDSCNACHQ